MRAYSVGARVTIVVGAIGQLDITLVMANIGECDETHLYRVRTALSIRQDLLPMHMSITRATLNQQEMAVLRPTDEKARQLCQMFTDNFDRSKKTTPTLSPYHVAMTPELNRILEAATVIEAKSFLIQEETNIVPVFVVP